jgi:uncharacterized membrane protein YphA (DoxX/SURF4 family)
LLEIVLRKASSESSVRKVQRLFATFPDGQPGMALLLLRLSLAAILLVHGREYWPGAPVWTSLICAGFGLLLLIGWMTPYVALLGAIGGAGTLLLARSTDAIEGAFTLAVMAALGLLGAGAYSLDARLYGRRSVVVPRRQDDRSE